MSIHPTLRYPDPAAAITFLTEVLGLTAEFVSTGDDGAVQHAELSFGATPFPERAAPKAPGRHSFRGGPDHDPGVLMIGPRQGPDDPFDTGRAVLYLTVDDPDARHDRAVAAGAEIVQGLVDQPYGAREFAVRDPDGNIWSLGTYRPAVKP
jgi:uncharacterized glyoxalase superfamily protein PhnB